MPVPVCYALLPAESVIRRGAPLNVLAVMECSAACTAPVRFWGSDGRGWRLMLEERRTFPAGEHVHLYFTLPAHCFLAPFWGGAAPEEVSLSVGEWPPDRSAGGVLIFVEG